MKSLTNVAGALLLSQVLSASIFIGTSVAPQSVLAKSSHAHSDFGQVEEEVIGGKQFSVSRAHIKAKPEHVWQVLTDFSNAPRVFPQLKKCEVVEDRGHAKIVKHTVAPSGMIGSFSYTLEIKETAPKSMEWHRISGDFKEVDGYWKLEPVDGGHGTLVTYSSHVTGGFLIPAALIRRQSRIDMPAVMVSLRNQTETSSVQIAGKPHEAKERNQ